MNNVENPGVTMEEARVTIEDIRGQVHTMGANDSEPGQIDAVVAELNNGDISPEDAVQKVLLIRDSKHGS